MVCAIDMMSDCSQLWLESEPELARYFQEQGIVQFLVSRQVDVIRLPLYGERLAIQTSIYDCQRFLGYRNTVILDEAGLPCLTSWSTGAFVVTETGKPARLPPELLNRIHMDPKVEMDYQSKKISPPEGVPAETPPPVRVSRHDVDFNRHMNNARYVQIALEYPGADFVISRFRAEYKRPAKYGDLLYPWLIPGGEGILLVSLTTETGEPYTVMELSGSAG